MCIRDSNDTTPLWTKSPNECTDEEYKEFYRKVFLDYKEPLFWIHMTTPVMTAALGRLLSAGAMMGAMMKGDKDIITLQIQCSGPAKGPVSYTHLYW